RAVLTRGRLGAAAGAPARGAGGAGGNPLDSASPGEREAVAQAQRRRPVQIAPGQRRVAPDVPIRTASFLNTLPPPLAIGLAVMAACALLSAAAPLRRLVRSRRLR